LLDTCLPHSEVFERVVAISAHSRPPQSSTLSTGCDLVDDDTEPLNAQEPPQPSSTRDRAGGDRSSGQCGHLLRASIGTLERKSARPPGRTTGTSTRGGRDAMPKPGVVSFGRIGVERSGCGREVGEERGDPWLGRAERVVATDGRDCDELGASLGGGGYIRGRRGVAGQVLNQIPFGPNDWAAGSSAPTCALAPWWPRRRRERRAVGRDGRPHWRKA
jgi:hypothetical protein